MPPKPTKKRRPKPAGVRWGKLHEIGNKAPIDSPEWQRDYPETRLRKLTAWRNLHRRRKHSTVRKHMRSKGVKPSSDAPLRVMIALGKKFDKR